MLQLVQVAAYPPPGLVNQRPGMLLDLCEPPAPAKEAAAPAGTRLVHSERGEEAGSLAPTRTSAMSSTDSTRAALWATRTEAEAGTRGSGSR